MKESTSRPLYSRDDLETLKTYDRAGVFQALGSFDEGELSEEAFAMRAAELLDARRVPGLGEALEADDGAAVTEAVYVACKAEGSIVERTSVSEEEIRQAEEVLTHCFRFYDEAHKLPADIDWDFNPGTAHWSHDLNRFSYLRPLTRAYWATGDTRFARKALDLILDWIAKCDFGKAFVGTPYVFGSYLNEAIHCEVWSWCLRQLSAGEEVRPIELLRILKSLHDQLVYLEIVTNGHSGNWPTIGCRGMLTTLAAFPVFRDTERFADYCTRTLAAQIDEQVLPDGVQDELTPHYHWCVLGNLLTVASVACTFGRALEPRTLAVLRKMVHYAQQTVVPDGSAQVAFNDSDPAAVPDVAEGLARAGLEECIFPPERLGPECFPYAGVAFLRQRQNEGDLYLAFDGGPFGRSHQHEDKLGFWLFAYGRNFLIDPGRHLYDWSETSYLAHLRSTRAHSTIIVDGAGQRSDHRPDTWIAQNPVPLDWSTREGEIRASAAYDLGYGDDNAIAVTHRREIVFLKERLWIVFDRVEGNGEHTVESRFQFAPGALRVEGTQAHTCFQDANLLLWARSSTPFADVHVEEGWEHPRGGWYSKRYGLVEPAPCLSLSATVELSFFAATLLFPYRGTEPPHLSFALEGESVLVQTEETGEMRVQAFIASPPSPTILSRR